MLKFYIAFFLFYYSTYYCQNISDSISIINYNLEKLDNERINLLEKLENLKLQKVKSEILDIGIPLVLPNEELITHSAMTLVYSIKHKQPKWVSHCITSDIINGNVSRTNDFRIDSLIQNGTAIEQDYFLKFLNKDSTYEYDGFGYDRGHMAPSADFRWSQKALSESYLYSNISPQVSELNREKWAELEGLLRGYIYLNPASQLYVTTGPFLHDSLNAIERSRNKVSIPEKFFKVVLDLKNKKAVGFVMYNQECLHDLSFYATSIDEIEKETGIDFFYQLDNDLEDLVESNNKCDFLYEGKERKDVSPIYAPFLSKNTFNSTQAKLYTDGKQKVTVCGTVVNSKETRNGHIFLNIDKNFPNQVFSVVIWKESRINFSYEPHVDLIGEKICVTGKIFSLGEIPTMVIKNEKALKLYKEEF